MPEAWLNSPCTDPLGRVFAREGRIFRALFRESADQALRTLEHPAVRSLMDDGLVARMWPSDLKVEDYGPVLEAEKAPFDVPCERFSFGALRQAALDWLEITRRLLPAGLALTDAHFGNFMLFGANRPRWIDFGSMRSAQVLPPESPFKAFGMFCEGMLAPLRVLATLPQHERLARLSIADHPAQGPRVAGNEAPLSAVRVLGPLERFEGRSPEEALRRAAELIPRLPDAPRAEIPALERKLLERVAAALQGVSSVLAIGAETFLATAPMLAGKDVLVVEPLAGSMGQLEGAIAAGTACRTVALYQQHCINRQFRRGAPRAEAVLVLDPMRALGHDSIVEGENIAETLSQLASGRVIAVSPYERRAATRQMLQQRFAAVDAEHFGWPYGGWDVLVCPV